METRTLLQHNFLHFDPQNLKRSFKVALQIGYPNKQIAMTYDVSIAVLNVWQSGNYSVRVIVNNFKVNDNEPDLMFEQLVAKCRKPFEKMIFTVSKNGTIEEMENHDEILDRWETLKERLEMEYSGALFEDYITKFEKILYSETLFLAKIKQDIFISQFFYPMYESAFQDFEKRTTETIKFFDIDYSIAMKLKINTQNSDDEKREMHISKRIDREKYDFKKMPIQKYEVDYTLNEKLEIKNITGEFVNYGKQYRFQIRARLQ